MSHHTCFTHRNKKLHVLQSHPCEREQIGQTHLIYQIIVSFLMAPILQETINNWHSCNELQMFAQSVWIYDDV